jgi:hypothetical protein
MRAGVDLGTKERTMTRILICLLAATLVGCATTAGNPERRITRQGNPAAWPFPTPPWSQAADVTQPPNTPQVEFASEMFSAPIASPQMRRAIADLDLSESTSRTLDPQQAEALLAVMRSSSKAAVLAGPHAVVAAGSPVSLGLANADGTSEYDFAARLYIQAMHVENEHVFFRYAVQMTDVSGQAGEQSEWSIEGTAVLRSGQWLARLPVSDNTGKSVIVLLRATIRA